MNSCKVESCKRTKIVAHGLCNSHYQKLRKYGDATISKPRTTVFKSGEEHNNWAGNEISYSGLHRRIRSIKGSATEFKCVDCDNQALEWSQTHGTTGLDPDHYQSRCRSCHVKYDGNPPPTAKCEKGCICGKHWSSKE